MAKNTYYFSHDYNAREDDKIKQLLFKHGWQGYGLYWALVESLYNNNGYMQYECERIAFELRTESKVIESIINDFDLFKMKASAFYSPSVLHRLNKRKTKSQKASESAKTRWEKEKAKDANALRTQSDSNAIKESKVKESKVKENYIQWQSESENKIYIGFVKWILEQNFEQIFKLKDQINEKLFETIWKNSVEHLEKVNDSTRGDRIKEVLNKLENRKDLLKDVVSLSRTVNDYLRKGW